MTTTQVPFRESSKAIDAYVREHLGKHEALYDLNVRALEAASPEVIISQSLCDVCAVASGDVLDAINSLPTNPLLIDLEPNTLEDVYRDLLRVGAGLGVTRTAAQLVGDLRRRQESVARRTAAIPMEERPRVAFLEWLDPPFNGGHWNPELVALAGGIDLLGNPGQPSSTQTWEAIASHAPEVVFVACCGFRVDRAREDLGPLIADERWSSLPAVKNDRVYFADGNAYFSSPSPRLWDGLEIMAHALHPDVYPPAAHGIASTV